MWSFGCSHGWGDRDAAWFDVETGIKQTIESINME